MMMPKPLFAAHVARMDAVRAMRIQDAADAAVVPHLKADAAKKMWQGWAERAAVGTQRAAEAAASLFHVDGQAVNAKALKAWFRKTVGRGAEVA